VRHRTLSLRLPNRTCPFGVSRNPSSLRRLQPTHPILPPIKDRELPPRTIPHSFILLLLVLVLVLGPLNRKSKIKNQKLSPRLRHRRLRPGRPLRHLPRRSPRQRPLAPRSLHLPHR